MSEPAITVRLKQDIDQLQQMMEAASFGGAETAVRVKSPEILLADLNEAVEEIERLGGLLNTATLELARLKAPAPSVAIERLVEEVRVEKDIDRPWGGYNRTYHRHNR